MKKSVAGLLILLISISWLLFWPGPEKYGQAEIISGVVPHHLLAEDIIRDFFSHLQKEDQPETLVLLSPDHFHQGDFFGDCFLTTDNVELQGLEVDKELIAELGSRVPFRFSPSLFLEHGITNLLPFIKEYLPETKIMPLIIPFSITEEKLQRLSQALILKEKVVTVASVDFSHHLPQEVADLHDQTSIRVLINFQKEIFPKIEVDSWQSLYVVRYLAYLKGWEIPFIIACKNSNDYFPEEELEETTSYFSLFFQSGKGNTSPEFASEERTFLFLGDIMLDRGVEKLMKRNSFSYPFLKISPTLWGLDYVLGNLEGPIVEDPVEFPEESLRFSFSNQVIEGLKRGHISLLCLANNHTGDMGSEALEETRDLLRKEGIIPIGDPNNEKKACSFTDTGFILLAFNCYPSFKEEEILKIIKENRENSPSSFLIVFFHWGDEYIPHSSVEQRELAHRALDSGADLILGSHPHVVQEIELYKPKGEEIGKLIFYSLGNFIFDQYSFKETQEGIIIGLELSQGSQKYSIIPFKSQLSQPELMSREERKNFLKDLAKKCSPELLPSIEKGEIEILGKN